MTRQVAMFKEGYDGPALEARTTAFEEKAMKDKHDEVRALARRLHAAILTAGDVAMGGFVASAGAPGPIVDYLVEFADMVGQEKEPEPTPRFQPTAAQISDMMHAMTLVDGLSKPYLNVLFLRALWEFHDSQDFDCPGWSWDKVGERCAMSGDWAKKAYEAVIVQASRRVGILPATPKDYAVAVAAMKFGTWRAYIGTALEPLQTIYDLKSKSPVQLERAFVLWLPGKPVAQRVAKKVKEDLRHKVIHSSWYYASPEELAEKLIEAAQGVPAPWEYQELTLVRRAA